MTPVLIVGAGPAGLSAALGFGRRGIPCIIAERRPRVGTHPRATGVRTRTMELFRSWGLEDEVRRAALPVDGAGTFVWKHTVAGEEFGDIRVSPTESDMAARRAASPSIVTFCAQDVIEPILLAAARRYPCVDIRFSTEVRDLEATDDDVTAELVTADARPERVRAEYLLACDGASSGIRRSLGISLEGLGLAVDFVTVQFDADLNAWAGDRPAVLSWIMNSASSGVLVTLEGRKRWLFTALQQADEETVTPDWCTRIVRDAIGVSDLELQIVDAKRWRMTAEVAQRFRDRRVFLVGDSAHRFPPTGGFGMNSSIQDAHNLVWKLAAVYEGWADQALLDTYEAERRPIAEFNSRQSAENMVLMAETGFGPDVYEFAALLEKGGEVGASLRRQIRETIPRQMAQFDGLGQDIGFGYRDGALIPDGSPRPVAGDPSEFIPCAAPGFRAPHHLLGRQDGTEISTLDLFGNSFVMMAPEQGGEWVTAAVKAAEERGIPLRAHHVGPTSRDLVDRQGTWADLMGTGSAGAVLVRPDGHVAWRTADPAPDGSGAAFGDVLDTLLTATNGSGREL